MYKCKLTVLKRMINKDLAAEYLNNPDLKPCELFTEGKEYIIDSLSSIPEGFCTWAWSDILRDIAIIITGGNLDWMKKEGTHITCCTDGFRPVVFKLERIE